MNISAIDMYQVYQVTALLAAPRLYETISNINFDVVTQLEKGKEQLVNDLIVPLEAVASDWDWEWARNAVDPINDMSKLKTKIQKIKSIDSSIQLIAKNFSRLTKGLASPLLQNPELASEIEFVNQEIEKLTTCCTKNLRIYQRMLQE